LHVTSHTDLYTLSLHDALPIFSYLSGFALNDEGREQAAMGIAVGDFNRDGLVDLYVTNFSDDYNTLYRNDGETSFTDVSFAAGRSEEHTSELQSRGHLVCRLLL